MATQSWAEAWQQGSAAPAPSAADPPWKELATVEAADTRRANFAAKGSHANADL